MASAVALLKDVKNKIGVCMLQQRNKAPLRAQDVARWMVLSTSETKVCNKVLVPELAARILNTSWQGERAQ